MIVYTPDEVENARLAAITTYRGDPESGDENPDWLDDLKERGKPGTFGYHEALHVASIQMDSLERYLLEHPAVLMDKDAYRLCHEAHTLLFNLYQHLGAIHLAEDGDEKSDKAA